MNSRAEYMWCNSGQLVSALGISMSRLTDRACAIGKPQTCVPLFHSTNLQYLEWGQVLSGEDEVDRNVGVSRTWQFPHPVRTKGSLLLIFSQVCRTICFTVLCPDNLEQTTHTASLWSHKAKSRGHDWTSVSGLFVPVLAKRSLKPEYVEEQQLLAETVMLWWAKISLTGKKGLLIIGVNLNAERYQD